MLAEWSMAPVVDALRAMRGLDTMSAVIFMSTIGDLGRFETPRQLMAYLGLVPSEQSSGSRIWRGGITKAGNAEARRVLVEAAWSYRYPPRLASEKFRSSLNRQRQYGISHGKPSFACASVIVS